MTCVSWFLSRVSVDYSSFLSVWSTYLHIIRLWFLSIAFRYTNSFGRTLVFTVLKWYPDFHEFHSHTFINTRRKTYLHPVILIWDSLCGFLSKSFRCNTITIINNNNSNNNNTCKRNDILTHNRLFLAETWVPAFQRWAKYWDFDTE